MIEQRRHQVLCLTWNVNQIKPMNHFFDTVRLKARQDNFSVAIFALQEIEMGSSSVAIAAAKDRLAKKAQVCSFVPQCDFA